jgi:acetoin utilization deacetylase AcuC-like enzyme
MMRAWSSARFTVPLPEGHRFPIAKYALLRDTIVRQGLLPPEGIEEPETARREDLALVHSAEYLDAVFGGTLDPMATRRLGFPWSAELLERARRTAQGTLEAARDALTDGAGVNLAGGTHHAFSDRGEGFCVFNDVAVAIRVLQREARLARAAIIDLDVHQGNGTAQIFEEDETVYTFSMHGEKNYPFHKERSRLDVGLPDGCDDATYLTALSLHLDAVLDAARPDLVFYLAGADPYVGDRFGRLGLSFAGLRERDRMVFEACHARGLPVVMTIAGGYAKAIEDIATIHAATLAELLAIYGEPFGTPARATGAVPR